MSKGIATLGELFPEKKIRCRIRSCNNLLSFSGDEAMQKAVKGELDGPEKMCDECFALFNQLQDMQVKCASDGCAQSWTWNRFQQLESRRRGQTAPPQGLCDSCRSKLNKLKDEEIPCRVKGCKNTWIYSRQEQIRHPDRKPAPKMCENCWHSLNNLQDREIPCRMHGCKQTWLWNRYQQLEHIASGKEGDNPPSRMCKDCFDKLRTLVDQELPCKVDECNRMWTYTAYAQVEHELQNGPDAPPPSKMCKQCYAFFLAAADQEIRCRNRGCQNTWTYTRSMQLHDWHLRRGYPVPHMCQECTDKVNAAVNQQIPCSVPGCGGTWTYAAIDQVRDDRAGRRPPPGKRCAACDQFLSENSSQIIGCGSCGGEIKWSAYEQLLCERGTFVKPALCAGCAEQKMSLGKPKEPDQKVHHHVVKMPVGGRWQADPALVAWPPHLTYEAIEKIENADIRVVALGDDLTFSNEDSEKSWPTLLESILAARLGGEYKVAVVNAGISGTTSEQALVRLPRDMQPFAPHLVVFSFIFGDSLLLLDPHHEEWRPNIDREAAVGAFERLLQSLAARKCNLMYWTANPVYARALAEEEFKGRCMKWALEQEHAVNQTTAQHTHLCHQSGVPILDVHSRFVVNGQKSARKWMDNWFAHNDQGARNIATWMADYILREKLIPLKVSEDDEEKEK